MTGSLHDIRFNQRVIAYTAAAMYGAAALDGGIGWFLPGDPTFSIVPVLVAFVMFPALLALGPRLPCWVLALFGPLGVALISYALATTPAAGDGAVLYALPVLWMTLFFERRGAIAIVSCVAVGHAIVLLSLPSSVGYPGGWLDVVVAACSISLVVLALEHRNQMLVGRLVNEARTDALTGLLNRRGFDERAAIELARARRVGAPMAMAIATFDLDYFKRINDEWGHEIGDRVLARVGEVLAQESRGIDVAGRIGGEEFVVLLPGSDSSGAEAFTERVRLALAGGEPSDLPVVRVSAGVVATRRPQDIQVMLEKASSALYDAKRSGRDQTVLYGGARQPTAPRLQAAASPAV